jgi:hypothetical protein
MKLNLLIPVSVAAVALAVTPAAHAKTYIGCATGAHDVKPRVAPGTCNTWYPWLSHAESAGMLTKIRWRHWGSRRATATAIMLYRTSRIRTELVAYWPRSVYGMRAYSKLRTKSKYGGGTMNLPWGYDLWPLL